MNLVGGAFLFWFLCLSTAGESPELLKFKAPPQISLVTRRDLFADVGILKTVRHCGGHSETLRWRRESCELTLEGPCNHKANVFTQGELLFIPHESSDSVGIIGKILDENRQELTQFRKSALPNSALEAGKEHRLQAEVAFDESLRGKLITVQVNIYREQDQEIALCSEGDFFIVGDEN